MKGITELGKQLRKMRIDNGEVLKDMADVLNITASYLSAVENGKRKAKFEWFEVLKSHYQLNEVDSKKLHILIRDSIDEFKFDLMDLSDTQKDVAMLFAREFKKMNNEDVKEFMRLLKKREV